MSNVLSFGRSEPVGHRATIPALIDLFAQRRRRRHDPFWLKENAELLQILVATGARVDGGMLAPLAERMRDLMAEVEFFPQYYRMYLSIAVDLAALGAKDVPLAELADFVMRNQLHAAELSDTHRGEALLLLRRAGVTDAVDPALDARLARIATNARAFCLPNRRAAYDLTHIVFHQSDYGRLPLARCADRRLSLIYAGMVAWLEDNLDLLAEVAIALRLSGEAVPAPWQAAICKGAVAIRYEAASPQTAGFDDAYHQFFVLNWASAILGQGAFGGFVPANAVILRQPLGNAAPLTELSMALLEMGAARGPDWAQMRWRLWPNLSAITRDRIAVLEEMTEFTGFFAEFARCPKAGPRGASVVPNADGKVA